VLIIHTRVDFIFQLIISRNKHENFINKSINKEIIGQRDHDESAAN
jgi:hypothetical protein